MRTLLLIFAAMIAGSAYAQISIAPPLGPGSQVPLGVGVQQAGPPAPPPVACTNQLVLNYSNTCALIGQAWGE